jgi:N-acetylglucosamine kinase-like BadF-type ATPase
MSSVPKSKRSPTKFEAEHHFYILRDSITELMLMDFGFSEEKYLAKIEKFKEQHKSAANLDTIVARYKKKCDSFNRWYINEECKAISDMLRKVSIEFSMANSIYPSQSAAKVSEYCQRRCHLNESIAMCYAIKQEIQHVIRTLPVDLNRYKRYDNEINKQILLYKGVRKADNRFLKSK